MKYTIIIPLIMLTACSPDPNGLRQPDSNTIIVSIIDRAEALRQVTDNTPVNHAEVK